MEDEPMEDQEEDSDAEDMKRLINYSDSGESGEEDQEMEHESDIDEDSDEEQGEEEDDEPMSEEE
jgi:hypothetical protein